MYIVLVTIYLKFESYIPLGYIFITDFKHANIQGYHNLHRNGVGRGVRRIQRFILNLMRKKRHHLKKGIFKKK